MSEYVNIRVDRHIYEGLGHLAIGLQKLDAYRGLKLSNAQVAQMALVRGIGLLEEEVGQAGSEVAEPKPPTKAKTTKRAKTAKRGKR